LAWGILQIKEKVPTLGTFPYLSKVHGLRDFPELEQGTLFQENCSCREDALF